MLVVEVAVFFLLEEPLDLAVRAAAAMAVYLEATIRVLLALSIRAAEVAGLVINQAEAQQAAQVALASSLSNTP
jgi:hypothetical protein